MPSLAAALRLLGGFRNLGSRGLEIRGLGFRGLGFRGLRFRGGSELRVSGASDVSAWLFNAGRMFFLSLNYSII